MVDLSGAPNTIRTCDLPLRRGMLYPSELPGHWWEGLSGDINPLKIIA